MLDETIDALSKVVDIRRAIAAGSSGSWKSRATSRIPAHPHPPDRSEVARFTAQRYRFPGVDIKARLFRTRWAM